MRQVAINETTRRYALFSNAKVAEFLAEKIAVKTPPVTATFDIFLSYRSDDIDMVMGVYEDLIRRGFTVYLDRIMDPQLDRTKVSEDTANVLRTRLMQSKTLFYAATDNAAASNWMPWELGFEDGYRGKSAIVPISDSAPNDFKGVEFVAIYPRAVPINSTLLAIIQPDTTFIANFQNWRDSLPKRKCGMPKCPLPA